MPDPTYVGYTEQRAADREQNRGRQGIGMGVGSPCFVGTEFRFGRMEKF